MKKLFTLILALVASLGSMFALDHVVIDGLHYNLDTTMRAKVTFSWGAYDSLEVVNIPPSVVYDNKTYSVTSIGDSAFMFSGMTSLSLPNSITRIGNSAFAYCNRLASITCEAVVPPTIGWWCWTKTSVPLFVPAESVEAYRLADGWSSFGGYICAIGEEYVPDYNILVQLKDSADSHIIGSAGIIGSFSPDTALFYAGGSYLVRAYSPKKNQWELVKHSTSEYQAYSWEDGDKMDTFNISLTQDTVINLWVEQKYYHVRIAPDDDAHGYISGYGHPRDTMVTYWAQIDVTARPNKGYKFIQWSDGYKYYDRTIYVTQDTVIEAVFAPCLYVDYVFDHAQGYVYGDTLFQPGVMEADIWFEALPYRGHYFVSWGDGNTENPRTLHITQGTTIEAIFAYSPRITYVCDWQQGYVSGDTILAPGKASDTITFTARPNRGYYFSHWADGDTINPRTLYLTQDTVMEAIFAIDSAQLVPQMYSFAGVKASDITTDGTLGTYSLSDGRLIPSVSEPGGVDLNVRLAGREGLTINYKNSNAKDNILKFHDDYMETFGRNVILTFTDVTPGDSIKLLVSAKGSRNAMFTALSGAYGADQEVSEFATVSFVAFSSTVQIKEINAGFRIIRALVGIDFSEVPEIDAPTMVLPDITVQVPYSESFLGSKGQFSIQDIKKDTLSYVWQETAYYGMKGTGYSKGPHTVESWLVSPQIVLPNDSNIVLSFETAINYASSDYDATSVKISTDNGATWTNVQCANWPTENSWTFYSIEVPLDAYAGQNVRIAFVYASLSEYANPTWEIRNFKVKILTYTLYTFSDETMGMVSGAGNYEVNEVAQIAAVANHGYHFTHWSDGNTDNPRQIEVTQDTTFTALFAVDRRGHCGDSLTLKWEYDSIAKALTISGNGTLNGNYTFGVEAPTTVEHLIIAEGVTAIGQSAFANYTTIKHISVPTTVTKIYEQAFYNCEGLEEIYSYRQTPCVVYSNTFDGIDKFNCTLHVLSASVDMYKGATGWRDFYYIKTIDAQTVTEVIEEVETVPADNNVTITWPVSEGADTYTIVVSKDGAVVCTLIFGEDGQLKGIAFAPSRSGKPQAPTAVKTENGGLRFTITGLESSTDYQVTVIAKDANQEVVDTHSSNFTTSGSDETPTGLNDLSIESKATKLLHNGQILILRGDRIYTMIGQEVR